MAFTPFSKNNLLDNLNHVRDGIDWMHREALTGGRFTTASIPLWAACPGGPCRLSSTASGAGNPCINCSRMLDGGCLSSISCQYHRMSCCPRTRIAESNRPVIEPDRTKPRKEGACAPWTIAKNRRSANTKYRLSNR